MNQLRDILNRYSRPALYAVFILSMFIRLHEFGIFKDFNSDKARQLHGAHSFIHGQGISYISYDLNTFKPLRRANIDWPPMYSWMAAGTSNITGLSMYDTSLLIDYAAIIMLWVALLWLCNLASLSYWQQILFFIFIGCSKTPFQGLWSSDLIGSTLFLISCCLNFSLVKRIESGKKQTVLFFLLQFILLASMILLKYSLFPAVASIAAMVLVYYYAKREKAYLRAGLILSATVITALGILLVYNQSIAGHSTAINDRHGDVDSALHFANLRYFYPFILDSCFYLGPFSSRLNSAMVNDAALLITLILFVCFTITLTRRVITRSASFLDSAVLTAMLFVSGFLVLLSVKFKIDEIGAILWTYVKEYRYYAPAVFLLLIFLSKSYGSSGSTTKKHMLGYLVLPMVIYGTLFKAYYAYVHNRANSFEALYGKVFAVSNDINKLADKDTYFMSYTGDMMFDAQLTSKVAISDIKVSMSYYNYFPDSTFKTPFTDKAIQPGKKIIVYLGDNKKMLDSVRTVNNHTIETVDGEQFLVIKN